MASSAFHQAVYSKLIKGGGGACNFSKGFQDFSPRSLVVRLQNINLMCIKQTNVSNVYKLCSIHTSNQLRALPIVFSLHKNACISQTTESKFHYISFFLYSVINLGRCYYFFLLCVLVISDWIGLWVLYMNIPKSTIHFLQMSLLWFWLDMENQCGMRRTCSLVVWMYH